MTLPPTMPSQPLSQDASQVRSTMLKPSKGFYPMRSISKSTRLLAGASLGVLALMSAVPAIAQPVQLGPVSVNDNADKNGLNHAPPLATMPSSSLQDTPQAVNVIDSQTMKS